MFSTPLGLHEICCRWLIFHIRASKSSVSQTVFQFAILFEECHSTLSDSFAIAVNLSYGSIIVLPLPVFTVLNRYFICWIFSLFYVCQTTIRNCLFALDPQNEVCFILSAVLRVSRIVRITLFSWIISL